MGGDDRDQRDMNPKSSGDGTAPEPRSSSLAPRTSHLTPRSPFLVPFRRVMAQASKELTQVIRDRLTLVLALVLPLILLALLGSAISLDVKDLPIVVQDLDQSPLSRRFIDVFRESRTFRIVELPAAEQPHEALERNQAGAALVIP